MPKKNATEKQVLPDPQRFNLTSFAEFLPRRDPIVGEDPGSFEGFREGMLYSLNPATPYECVIAENLIQIEWELVQHRRMREACLLHLLKPAIANAVFEQQRELALDEACAAHVESGGTENDWQAECDFDEDEAEELGSSLAERSTARDLTERAKAYDEVSELGLNPVELMSEAYRGTLGNDYSSNKAPENHDAKVRELERRRLEVKRDYDQLQQSRPHEGTLIEG